jgi:hypothetical protein
MLFGRTRDDRIQEFFEKHINNTAQCAEELHALFSGLPKTAEEIATATQRVIEMERTGDDFKEHIHLIVDKTFITRLHKDDIDRLIHELDRVIDQIKKVVLYVRVYSIPEARAEALQFCQLIVEMTRELVKIIAGLAKPDVLKLRERVARIEDLEEEADLLLNTSLATVFRYESDAKNVLAWQSILEKLEEVTDACHHVANLAMSIARKES